MKTLKITDTTHKELLKLKAIKGSKNLDHVIIDLLLCYDRHMIKPGRFKNDK